MHFSSSAAIAAILLMAGTALTTPVAAPSPGLSTNGPLVFSAAHDSEGGVEKRSYTGSCKDCNVYYWNNDITLECACSDKAGRTVYNQLPLTTCLGNSDGQLYWGKNGGFQGSCRQPSLNGQKYFKAECRNNAGVWALTREINLEEKIHNDNGWLVCHV
ncbi:Cyanovirin-N [Rhypophila decipiens]